MGLRIRDIATALTARTYSADGELQLSIDGETWSLIVREGKAVRCARSDAAPDLVMQRDALGALYLGGVSAARLARAERIAGSAAALGRADRMFASPVAPWCPELF